MLHQVLKNFDKKEKLNKNIKYTIAKIEKIEMGGKNWSNCTYYINGTISNSYTKIITDSEKGNFLGKKFLVKFDSLNLKNSKILLEYPILDSVPIPLNGWKEVPQWIEVQ
ncbi:MAG: hypothetical protein CSA38_00940 [Flavobacteriales bacterium]|nr:MAG: hypothetical protein CSA38_00940 [Flavobacteriales bacterium]